jgi:drug/metabolite transporter (DMT)-like permease
MARSLFGAIAGLFYFEGLKYLPLSEATVLVRTAPIWTALIAIYILK